MSNKNDEQVFDILEADKKYRHILSDEIMTGREWCKLFISSPEIDCWYDIGSHLMEVKKMED